MTTTPTMLDSDFRYIDKKGNLLKSRTELSIAQMLSFLGQDYDYDYELEVNGKKIKVDFRTEKGLIEVIDNEEDIEKYREIKESKLDWNVMAIGHPKYAAQIKELQDIVFYDQKHPQTGSIFMEDQSFTFDYAHILPLVEKCSILHGHTSSVMVELVGQMKNNLLIDFGEAKKIIKEVIGVFDHKFFINRKYMNKEDDSHYHISFDGPKGVFDLQVPKNTTYLLEGEATVENLSTEIIKILAPKLPPNVEAVGVYIYEGYNKGSHIISNIARK
ncbi:MAG: 6-pyruvoyl tetrahydropterin synthase [Crenarchaeota archaeon]|nr:MAG: 6-pyruvoyl tetrahydropterin synthase [Thermoproteota archaeon]RDJ33096.1 MAG: 6-pyruvoyl tetrahydropterin synthase [Thermoproteota archaeon]RDJ36400.1 MAG: 6-pyruvoyl tetrahydropterin synthase [Thermoproteota archaeon]RDJ39029.1 MAG: 6-pyruvoyl tetrahydropterin synthase [Thermoproteota archaeon]